MSDEPQYPVKERIVQAIVAALEKISTANGYATAAVEVIRPRRTGEKFAPADKGIAVIQDAEQRETDDDLVGNPPAIAWRLPVACDAVVRVSERATEPMDQMLNILEADVRKALAADGTFGGLAIRSELGATEYPEPASGAEGLTVWLDVIYRVSENDPYVNRA